MAATPPPSPAARARRLLDRVAFGPAPEQVERVARAGPEAWLAAQLDRSPPPEPTPEWVPPELVRRPESEDERRDMRRELRRIGIALASERIERAAAGREPLAETMVDFWANHFAIGAKKGPEAALLPGFEYEVLRPHALGRFEDLLLATARHPAMLFYLDNWRSASEPERRRRGPFASRLAGLSRRFGRPDGLNENYARELLELHTLGVDGGYTQTDVEEVARAFTGWTLTREDGHPAFRFRSSWHDDGPKTVLGVRLPAGGGARDGERVIALLARHPSTARFLARKLAVRFLADEPPEAAVARAAARFTRSGGDLRETLRALLLEGDELFAAELVKVKTPFELVVSALRATGARLDHALGSLAVLRRLGHVPYLAPTPAGYPDRAEAWVDPGGVLERTRFAFALSAERVPGVRLPELARLEPRALLAGRAGAATERALETPGLSSRERLALALASPEFSLR